MHKILVMGKSSLCYLSNIRRYCTISEYTYQNMKKLVRRKSEKYGSEAKQLGEEPSTDNNISFVIQLVTLSQTESIIEFTGLSL